MADSDHQVREEPAHPDQEKRGEGGQAQGSFFSALQASVWLKNKAHQLLLDSIVGPITKGNSLALTSHFQVLKILISL